MNTAGMLSERMYVKTQEMEEMGLYYSPGKEAFRQIRKAEYVDKSGMISFVNSRINVPKSSYVSPVRGDLENPMR